MFDYFCNWPEARLIIMASISPLLVSTGCLRCNFPFKRSPISAPRTWSRSISAYGYTQAKALVYSEHGNPADVLS